MAGKEGKSAASGLSIEITCAVTRPNSVHLRARGHRENQAAGQHQEYQCAGSGGRRDYVIDWRNKRAWYAGGLRVGVGGGLELDLRCLTCRGLARGT